MQQRGQASAARHPARLAVAPANAPARSLQARVASRHLLETWPELSAGAPLWRWQRRSFVLMAVSLTAAALFVPRETLSVLFAVLALPFFCVVSLRAVALWSLARVPQSEERCETPEMSLPRYSVLVPLYREAEVAGDLVTALRALDYPAAKLEILLIVEGHDDATRAALERARPPSHFRIVVVPDGTPRTKPRALNYALQQASGDYVAIYDAEDCPEPDQLRNALALLRGSQERIGCVQARLGLYNPGASWLTRQFTIEYAALFHALLPALSRLGLPVPLSGTSNHFPRQVLDEVGGWDPYNVTEDADLGIRLARAGYAVQVLDSTTVEEAPAEFGPWFRQRTRWLKGWMQTYLVHTREPQRLWRELGPRGFIGLQILMGGLILSALVHPWFYVMLAADLWHGLGFAPGATSLGSALWWLGLVNLVAGYATAVAVGVAAVRRAGHPGLARHAALMPVYWLAISFAAYRALWQLVQAPYLWEKTQHSARSATQYSRVL